jgi:superfamily II DNA or RNA helicase
MSGKKSDWLDYFASLSSNTKEKARAYFLDDRVIELRYDHPVLRARVQGSGYNTYTVIIQVNERGLVSNCSCPVGVACKHLGAVLLAADHEGLSPYSKQDVVSEPTPTAFPKLMDIQGQTYEIKPSRGRGFPDRVSRFRALSGPDTRPRDVPVVGREQWRLAFKVVQMRSFYDNTPHVGWVVEPAMRYLKKKTGEPGRISSYAPDRLTQALSAVEKEILRTCEQLGQGAGFLRLMEDLVSGTSSLDVCIQGDDSPVELVFLDCIHIAFTIVAFSASPQIRTPHVLWSLGLSSSGGNSLSECIVMQVGKGLLFLNIGGQFFYLRDGGEFSSLVEDMISQENEWTIDDIYELEQRIRGNPLFSLEGSYGKIAVETPKPMPIVSIHMHHGEGASSVMELCFIYGARRVPYSFKRDAQYLLTHESNNGGTTLYHRRLDFEATFYNWLHSRLQDHRVQFFDRWQRPAPSGDKLYLDIFPEEFLGAYGQEFLDLGIALEVEGKRITVARGSFAVRLESSESWFDFIPSLSLEDGEAIPIPAQYQLSLEGMLSQGTRYIHLSPEDADRLRTFLALREGDNPDAPDFRVRVHGKDFKAIQRAAGLLDAKEAQDKFFVKARTLADSLTNSPGMPTVPPGESFTGKLRKYQQAGLNWLCFLHDHGLNGLLADDMGLGKTIQTIALLSVLRERNELGLVVIVAPVSTMGNWQREFNRFAPTMKVIIHHGQGRDLDAIGSESVCIVSYATLRNDIEFFKQFSISYLILDEAQTIKNSKSMVFKSIRDLTPAHRISLSGTPVENNTSELWSQMDFLEPGLLGSHREFQKQFATPIEARGDKVVAERLRQRVFPFILRRRKSDVVKDLPKKEEIVLFVEMAEDQRLFYESVRQFYAEQVEESINAKGLGKSAIAILEGLLRLRQVALFPALVDPTKGSISSCKFEALKDLLSECSAEGQKTLVFSQFVQSLSILQKWLDGEKLSYTYLDGNTKDRVGVIERFQEDPRVSFFLLSLKAGGVGINLTAAEYVILFDPWWNPAVESQAVDRSHRIGQKNKVIVYKLIVKGTVEEKILDLQQRKKDLVNQLVTEDAGFFKSLTAKDVLNLFAAPPK